MPSLGLTQTGRPMSWAAAQAAAGAAVAVDGKMVDRPVMIKAERLVALAMQKR